MEVLVIILKDVMEYFMVWYEVVEVLGLIVGMILW